jgi:hypothetical protein
VRSGGRVLIPSAYHLHLLADFQKPRTQTLSVETGIEASSLKVLVVLKNELLRLPPLPQRSSLPIL